MSGIPTRRGDYNRKLGDSDSKDPFYETSHKFDDKTVNYIKTTQDSLKRAGKALRDGDIPQELVHLNGLEHESLYTTDAKDIVQRAFSSYNRALGQYKSYGQGWSISNTLSESMLRKQQLSWLTKIPKSLKDNPKLS